MNLHFTPSESRGSLSSRAAASIVVMEMAMQAGHWAEIFNAGQLIDLKK